MSNASPNSPLRYGELSVADAINVIDRATAFYLKLHLGQQVEARLTDLYAPYRIMQLLSEATTQNQVDSYRANRAHQFAVFQQLQPVLETMLAKDATPELLKLADDLEKAGLWDLDPYTPDPATAEAVERVIFRGMPSRPTPAQMPRIPVRPPQRPAYPYWGG